jgi:hypothetical protein
MVGTAVAVSSTPRPNTPLVTVEELIVLVAARTGVTALVVRADSRLDGPDATELTSNAMTE